MEPEFRKKRAEKQPVIPERENDGLRVLARIIARSIIRQQSQSKQAAFQKQADIPPESSV